jgi:glyoxylase-like metal-dependent hydrolase (beta-lactamase superfamily II)
MLKFLSSFYPRYYNRASLSSLGLGLAVSATLMSCTEQSLQTALTDDMTADILAEKAITAIGGRANLSQLKAFSLTAKRSPYMTGQGPIVGTGMLAFPKYEAQITHDLVNNRFRLDIVRQWAAKDGGIDKYESTELVKRQAGYASEDDLFRVAEERDQPMIPERVSAAIKTEELLHPHLLLMRVLQDPTRALLGSEDDPSGRRLSEDEIFPITLDRIRQSGKRELIVTTSWLEKWANSDFYKMMVDKTSVNSSWLERWSETPVSAETHRRLVIQDEVHPITLFVDVESGRIDKLETLEYDYVFGDLALEVYYRDWQVVDGIALPMRLSMTLGGTPSLQVERSNIVINPELDESQFEPPDNVTYVHNEALAERGRRISQNLMAFSRALGRSIKESKPEVIAKELLPGVHLLGSEPFDLEAVYTMVVEQQNSVIVMEPGMSSLKGEAVIEWIAQQYPGKPISHLVISHAHNDHSAGFRSYVAAGAAVISHESSVEFYRTQAERPASILLPDALDRNPIEIELIGVPKDGLFRIEDPVRSVVIYPVAMGHTNDMVMAAVTELEFLYTGDLYVSGIARLLRQDNVERQPGILPFHSAISLHKTIEKYGLKVSKMVGSHDQSLVDIEQLEIYIND